MGKSHLKILLITNKAYLSRCPLFEKNIFQVGNHHPINQMYKNLHKFIIIHLAFIETKEFPFLFSTFSGLKSRDFPTQPQRWQGGRCRDTSMNEEP